ncbi:hypothetical protein [Nostoc sp.]|uniref:hypothetical protein n=1 Tax=Nostoc sp. TaxID=1180 RepID=UPI0030060C88
MPISLFFEYKFKINYKKVIMLLTKGISEVIKKKYFLNLAWGRCDLLDAWIFVIRLWAQATSNTAFI